MVFAIVFLTISGEGFLDVKAANSFTGWTSGQLNTNDGHTMISSSTFFTSDYVSLSSGNLITFSSSNSSYYSIWVYFYDVDDNFIASKLLNVYPSRDFSIFYDLEYEFGYLPEDVSKFRVSFYCKYLKNADYLTYSFSSQTPGAFGNSGKQFDDWTRGYYNITLGERYSIVSNSVNMCLSTFLPCDGYTNFIFYNNTTCASLTNLCVYLFNSNNVPIANIASLSVPYSSSVDLTFCDFTYAEGYSFDDVVYLGLYCSPKNNLIAEYAGYNLYYDINNDPYFSSGGDSSEGSTEGSSEIPSEPQVTAAPIPSPSAGYKVIDLNWEYNTYIDVEDGSVIESDYFCCTSDYIALLDNATYTVGIGDMSVENTLLICCFDENKDYISYSEIWAEVSSSKEVILNLPADVKYIRIVSNASDPDDDIQSAVCDSIYLWNKMASGNIDDETLQGIQDAIQQGNEQSSIQHSEQMAQSSKQHAEQMQVEKEQLIQSSEQHAEQMEIEQEQAETQKGILNKITDFFGNFFDNLKNFVVGIFVPGPDEMAALFDELNTFFSEKFGFLYYPFDFLIRAFNALMSEGSSTLITFPGFSIMGYEVWPDIPVDIAENEMVDSIFSVVRIVNGSILSLAFINYLRNFFDKRFGGGGN